MKSWSSTQVSVATSSGKAELYAMAGAGAEGLGMKSLLNDLGWDDKVIVKGDSSAALGAFKRKGAGKPRHVQVKHLWLQEVAARGDIFLLK